MWGRGDPLLRPPKHLCRAALRGGGDESGNGTRLLEGLGARMWPNAQRRRRQRRWPIAARPPPMISISWTDCRAVAGAGCARCLIKRKRQWSGKMQGPSQSNTWRSSVRRTGHNYRFRKSHESAYPTPHAANAPVLSLVSSDGGAAADCRLFEWARCLWSGSHWERNDRKPVPFRDRRRSDASRWRSARNTD